MGPDEDGEKKFAVAHVSYDPETTLALAALYSSAGDVSLLTLLEAVHG
jgi:hypothetical protein